jgi:hypothetical protein
VVGLQSAVASPPSKDEQSAGLVVLREGRPIAAGPLEVFFVDGRISSAAVDAWLQQSAMASPAFLPACAAGSTDSEVKPRTCLPLQLRQCGVVQCSSDIVAQALLFCVLQLLV